MTTSEYDEWEAYLEAAFPEMQNWLAERDDRTRSLWYKALRNVPYHEASIAVELMHSGEEDKPYHSGIPKAVRTIALRLASQSKNKDRRSRYVIDGEQTVACYDCQDVGVRSVWHPKSIRAIRDGVDDALRYTVAVACNCAAGLPFEQTCLRYDPERMPLWQPPSPDGGFYPPGDVEVLKAWLRRPKGWAA